MKSHLLITTAILGLSTAAFAGDRDAIEYDVSSKTTFRLGAGYLNLHANEIAFGGDGQVTEPNTLSHLEWDTEGALSLDLGLEHEISDRLTFFVDGVIGLTKDNSHMVDYDFLRDGSPVLTDRSLHPATELDHYYQIDLGIDYTLIESDKVDLALRLGVRYTDVKWTAFGGSFVYTDDPNNGPLNNDVGTFPAGEVIEYRQQLPGAYLGPQASVKASERLTISGGGIAGLSFSSQDTDFHFLRGDLFKNDFDPAAIYGGNIGVDYLLTPRTTLYLKGNYDRYALMKGSTEISDLDGGNRESFGGDAAGATLESWQVKAGLKINF